MATPPSGPGADLFTVFSMLGLAGDRHAMATLNQQGYHGFRRSHNVIVHLLLDGPHTVGEMAPRLQVTQQAVSKTVRELASHGYVDQLSDTADRRRRPVVLTDRGREAVALADRARAELLQQLEQSVGADRFGEAAAVMQEMMDQLGLTQVLRDRMGPTTPQAA